MDLIRAASRISHSIIKYHTLVVNPKSEFTLPLSGSYQNDALLLSNQGFKMPITGINIPFNLFELRSRLNEQGVMSDPAVFANTDMLSILNSALT